jgi:hypothetical protein
MLEQRRADNTIRRTMLYRIVFESSSVRYAVFLLFLFLLLQPAAPVFADEVSDAPLAAPSETEASFPLIDTDAAQTDLQPAETFEEPSSIPIEESISDEVQDSELVPEVAESVTSTEEVASSSPEESTNTDAQATSSQPEVLENDGGGSSEATTTQPDTSSANTDTDTTISDADPSPLDPAATSTAQGSATTTEESVSSDEVSADTNNAPHDTQESNATSTQNDQQQASSSEAVLIQHNSNTYAFDAKECATVGDGAFYCSTPKDADAFTEDGVFSAPDADGDEEIFVRVNGKETQLTHNSVDDSAPYYDALSDRIVWHRSVNDRYQIISYDLKSQEETQVTSTSYNNMEPVAYGDITLWQAWVGTNWEIMLYDGETVRQLTHNDVHDISPHMRGSYIVWQTQFADGWQVAVYDQETGHIEYVKTDGGAKVENPRFVLVYDSTDARGDIQTVGYDPDQKVSFTLHRIPTDVPEKLPEPDQTGETRALIQNKQGTRDGELDNLDTLPQTGNGSSTSTASSTQSSGHTLDLSTASSTATSTMAATSTPEVTDIVIPAYTATSSTAETATTTAHIDDVVIPPIAATSSAEVR